MDSVTCQQQQFLVVVLFGIQRPLNGGKLVVETHALIFQSLYDLLVAFVVVDVLVFGSDRIGSDRIKMSVTPD